MPFGLHPDLEVRKLAIGSEKAPLLVIDQLLEGAEQLVDQASSQHFEVNSPYFPGIRCKAPLAYLRFITRELRPIIANYFEIGDRAVSIPMCHFSLVTTPPYSLHTLQRIPHIDSMSPYNLATIHYLFRGNLGGTAFYRHRATGFEYIDGARQDEYWNCLNNEVTGGNKPAAAYINGDTPLFEKIASQDGKFNRMLVYRQNSLHSGAIAKNFQPDNNPVSGRLSINSFMNFL